MDEQANQNEPVRDEPSQTGANPVPSLLTVSQAYDYLIGASLPRSKKTIRKWCRHDHVEWKEIAVPGGAKWLITRSSLDARIAEERMINASLTPETGPDRSGQGLVPTGANPSAPVRDDALVEVLKEQLAHERDARIAAETKSRELIDKYHEISLASARMGVNSLPTETPFSHPIATPPGVQEWAYPRSAQEGPAPAAQRPRRCAERRAREAPVHPRG